jgi:hypothetical protein
MIEIITLIGISIIIPVIAGKKRTRRAYVPATRQGGPVRTK